MYKDFLRSFERYIKYLRIEYPVLFEVKVTCKDKSTYIISDITSHYDYYITNIGELTSNKIVSTIEISAKYPEDFPLKNEKFNAFQVLYDYVKMDSTNVFHDAPINWNIVSSTEENNMRIATETYLGINENTALWSDKRKRVKGYKDVVVTSVLDNYGEKLKPIIDKCRNCDIFTCTCNGISYGRVSCLACDAKPGVAGDKATPCSCYATTYTKQTCTCYSPMNALNSRCKCGYATTPMCNGYTCWCNQGTKHVF